MTLKQKDGQNPSNDLTQYKSQVVGDRELHGKQVKVTQWGKEKYWNKLYDSANNNAVQDKKRKRIPEAQELANMFSHWKDNNQVEPGSKRRKRNEVNDAEDNNSFKGNPALQIEKVNRESLVVLCVRSQCAD